MWRVITILSLIMTFCLNNLQMIPAQETRLSGLVMSMEWSADGSKVAIVTVSNGVWVFSENTLYLLFGEQYALNDTAWGPDSHFLAILFAGGVIEIRDVTDLNSPKVIRTFSDDNVHFDAYEEIDWQAFINEVEAQRGNKISEDCANDLIEMAQYLLENQ